jgi:Protein of unknown function (DUF3662)/FHA domain
VRALQRFEQRLEQVVTGAFARAFRSAVQPMEIAAALQREVDNSAQILSRDRRLAPNNFTIELAAADFDRLSTYGETLSSELAAMLHEYAEDQRYIYAGLVHLTFQRTEGLTTGRFRVRSSAAAQVTPAPGQRTTDTAIRQATLFLEVNGTRHPVHAPGLVIGRGSAADLKVDDPGVSRRHVQLHVQPNADVTLVDLGSTNGTLVNGQRVNQARLGDGSVIQIGGTKLVLHARADQSPPASGAPAQGPGSQHDDPQPWDQPWDQPARPQPWEQPASPQSWDKPAPDQPWDQPPRPQRPPPAAGGPTHGSWAG